MPALNEWEIWLLVAVILVLGSAGGLLLRAVNAREEINTFKRSRAGEAFIQQRSESIGLGCLLQLLGLAVCIGAIFSLQPLIGLIGICLLIIGGRKSRWLQCSACTGRIAEKTATICPHCRSPLG